MAAGRGQRNLEPDLRAVSEHGVAAFIDTSTTHNGVRGYAGYLLWEHLYMTLRRVFAGSSSVWCSVSCSD
jgi:hypothetical protein